MILNWTKYINWTEKHNICNVWICKPMSGQTNTGRTRVFVYCLSSFSLPFSPKLGYQGFLYPLPLIWDGFTKLFGGYKMVLINSNLWNPSLVFLGLLLYSPRELLVFITLDVQSRVTITRLSEKKFKEMAENSWILGCRGLVRPWIIGSFLWGPLPRLKTKFQRLRKGFCRFLGQSITFLKEVLEERRKNLSFKKLCASKGLPIVLLEARMVIQGVFIGWECG